MIQSRWQPSPLWQPYRATAREFLGVEVIEEEGETVVGVEEQVEEAEEEVRIVVKEVKGVVTDGPTSRSTLTTLLHQSVKNITFLANLLIGVKSQLHVPGRTILLQKTNEKLTSLILMK